MHAIFALRLAIRSLFRRPSYALIVIAVLGLGIGASASIFSLVDAVLIQSLPYDHPASLVVLFADGSGRGQSSRATTTPGDYFDWRDESHAVFTDVAALRNVSPRITSLEAPVVPLTHAVTANYFAVLGSTPMLGRAFRDGEDAPGRDDVVMMSYALWTAKFGGDPALVGRSIDLDGVPHTVIGVMGPDFYSAHVFNVQPDLWIPAPFTAQRDDRVTRDVMVYGRLKPGVAVDAAQAAMRVAATQIARQHPDTNDRWSVSVVPIRDHVVGAFARLAAFVMAAVGLVLLIACANVANLALARGAERTSEVAVRVALGASRARVIGELLTETALLAALGAVAGTVIAMAAIPLLIRLIPANAGVPFLHRAAVDARLLLFTTAVSAMCAALSGLLPSREASRPDVIDSLRRAGRTGHAAGRVWRQGLVAFEVALAVVVIVCATLMAQTIVGLGKVSTGFRADRIAKLRTSLRGEAFAAPAARVAHFNELQRRLSAIPGVQLASAISFEPPSPADQVGTSRLHLPGDSLDAAAARTAMSRVVLPDYFETMGIPVLSGRGITRDDRAETVRVAVISATMASRYWPDGNPIGHTFTVDAPRPVPLQVVGVAGDVFTAGVDPSAVPVFYLPYAQSPVPVMTAVMRVPQGDVAAPLHQAESIAWSLSPFTNVYAIGTLQSALDALNWRERFAAVVLTGFAALGLVLAVLGLYAVIAYTVSQRRSEIGLRMALGATGGAIVRGVMREGLRMVGIGLVLGNIAAVLFSRTLSGMLYNVKSGDATTFVVVSAAMLTIASCACATPALAAARIDPQDAMRPR